MFWGQACYVIHSRAISTWEFCPTWAAGCPAFFEREGSYTIMLTLGMTCLASMLSSLTQLTPYSSPKNPPLIQPERQTVGWWWMLCLQPIREGQTFKMQKQPLHSLSLVKECFFPLPADLCCFKYDSVVMEGIHNWPFRTDAVNHKGQGQQQAAQVWDVQMPFLPTSTPCGWMPFSTITEKRPRLSRQSAQIHQEKSKGQQTGLQCILISKVRC